MSGFNHEAHWSARYLAAGEDYLFGTAPNRFLAQQESHFAAGMEVLSVADGEGRNAVWLAEQGCRVTATEISPVALEKAAKLARARHVEVNWLQADILNWEWPVAAYDAVVGIFIQFATPAERPRQLAGLQRAVRTGGLVFLHGYTPRQLEFRTGGPSAAENLYTETLLRDSFAGWEILVLREHIDDIAEGSGHAGKSALIDLVARKAG